MTSSALEHTMFETIVGVEAVSSIKALQVAGANGIPIHQIDASNISTKLPLLQLSSEVKTDIQNAVSSGKTVTVSEQNIQLNEWNGVGYIILDPNTGAGAYMISGGLAGGSLTSKVAGYQDFISRGEMTTEEAQQYIRTFRGRISFRSPTNWGGITSQWNPKRNYGGTVRCHNGVDIGVQVGSNVYAIASGDATANEQAAGTGYGKYIEINHGLGVYSLYGHLDSFVATGSVTEEALIAKSGNTGQSSGPHVHFSIFLTSQDRPLRTADGFFNCAASVDPESFDWLDPSVHR